MDLCEIARQVVAINPDWESFFTDPVVDRQLRHISDRLTEQLAANITIYPAPDQIFRAFALTPLSQLQVVILAQDPYPTEYSDHQGTIYSYATGLALSVPRNAPLPSSLHNIFRELSNTYHRPSWSDHGDLTYWATQGVFLLNTALTVIRHQKESHLLLWEGFTGLLLTWLTQRRPSVVYLAFGAKAAKRITTTLSNPTMLTCSHPSGLSASRGETPFLGSNIFARCNHLLLDRGLPGVDWRLPL